MSLPTAWLLDLAPVRNPALLATTMARTLGLAPPSAEAAEAHLAEALRDRELLLVTDNLEHLLEETQLLARMMSAIPALRVLATSRIPLRLYGEHTVRVPPLQLPGKAAREPRSATAKRCSCSSPGPGRSGRTSPRRPASWPLSAEICAAVDGLPLAIELAAARIRLYSPSALLPLLRSRLALLTGGPRDLPHRQQTLRAALDWSYALLSPARSTCSPASGCLPGRSTPPPPPRSAGTRIRCRRWSSLADLADQSLLEIIRRRNAGFRMLQTVREYALARLAEAARTDPVRRRHLAHFLSVARPPARALTGPARPSFSTARGGLPEFPRRPGFRLPAAGSDRQCLGRGAAPGRGAQPALAAARSLAEGVLQLDRLLACDDAQQRRSRRRPGRRPCWPPARWPVSRAITRGPRTWPGRASSCAPRWTTTGAWPGRTVSWARRRWRVGHYAAAEPHFERQLVRGVAGR